MSRIAPYGSWPSPIGAELTAEHDGRPGWLTHAGGFLWWVRPMPAQGGRSALLRARRDEARAVGPAGWSEPEVVVPAPWNVRTRVHEYGGLAYLPVPASAGQDGHPGQDRHDVVFAEFSDQRLYRLDPDAAGEPWPLTPVPSRPSGWRYAEPVLAPDAHEVWCVREEHTGPEPTDVRRSVVAVPLDGSGADDASAIRELVVDRHFLACLRPSPDGRLLAWIGWEHPNMPWDGAELRVAVIDDDGTVGAPVTVAGGPDESIAQAEWIAADTLVLAGDASGWWNLRRLRVGADGRAEADELCPRAEEFAGPLWQLGMRWFEPLPDGRLAVIHGRATTSLGILDPATGKLEEPAAGDYTEWAPTLTTVDGVPVGVAGGPSTPFEIAVPGVGGAVDESVVVGGEDRGEIRAVLPASRPRTFTGPDGREVHAIVHPPQNPHVTAPDGEPAPYVVFAHGGPTGRVPLVHDLEVAFFTSRGIGVVEVNYGGSTGHGRAYRDRLRRNWGVVDVDDCVTAAIALVDEGAADPARLGIRGGSAGGWTSAAALVFSDVFACATIMYPVVDLTEFRTGGTHDFESQYLESLVGPWPQEAERYRERSPVTHPERVSAPFVLLQGLEDEICPPAQCERFVASIAGTAGTAGTAVPHAYLTFEGEQHGFRRKETIVATLHAELSLYAQVFGFTPADDLPELTLVR
ncbi:dipeptidyl aminopeptidase/acylaminoacyl peptidase [Haloactinopolyspora alba]|uniref:Dipeptidyl aminopeptidase/acylaminoacyl peptidase n=1 Tax=Haloactinopolyspora alba TaxID=648780 RepID=A0A2P8DVA0_9ACTN|nr:prolyl oligopeptidase family serine peptidase [Haloactinopolyspora alba]PSL01163.1 dipeptidyl aminopeptidase/acylaminoacyl peptidase [Haloactinopolyspora alba]